MAEVTFNMKWDEDGKRTYKTGVDRVAFYKIQSNGQYGDGHVWNGVTQIDNSPSGAEPTKIYADNTVYATLMSLEEYAATVQAYDSDPEFDECDGMATLGQGLTVTQQTRKKFALTYREKIGNDTEGNDHGYVIHLIYACTAKPTASSAQTINDSQDLQTLSWELSTEPVKVPGMKDSAHFIVNTLTAPAEKVATLEAMLYGSGDTKGKFPTVEELVAMFPKASA